MKLNYGVYMMDNMTLTEQVRLMALNATIYIGAHGNAMGNAWWMKKHSWVLEVHPKNGGSGWSKHIYSDALNYFTVKCDKDCGEDGGAYHVDLGRVRMILENVPMR
jgi:capsular polysaccharide biosynthesis protein